MLFFLDHFLKKLNNKVIIILLYFFGINNIIFDYFYFILFIIANIKLLLWLLKIAHLFIIYLWYFALVIIYKKHYKYSI